MNDREVLRQRLMAVIVEALADPNPEVVFELADRLCPVVEQHTRDQIGRMWDVWAA